ncbi:bifunctional biotin--[acetyl-CoA-carboxylase] ligase/biotin operon repressor BirA [Rheinheimera sp.]|uniref:bifunctional biotin--[acetyl-CoA-carboxylase] ligase/biotin operon repressor BirA n=1 Tax=Rheinheimera sp. TaxID=1869214 RepID=UPI00263972B5|nr:bifunctional biotin--[acetyl-CoA-carboxylase] ligase/biotin operon repressor BirA [Rheinheimera sp.]MCA1931852.1 bifunctional biotin--[acetyl-CoA-carboxylase] ligase/biotin operon repressor BirA [Rheinheimera sp.]
MAIEQRKTLPHSLIVQRQLVLYLADGALCSGQWLGEQLGISRTAVAKHLEQLQRHGLDLYKIKGKGYRLAQPVHLLDAAQIKAQQQQSAPVWVQSVTDSTNSQLMQKLKEGVALEKGTVLVAEAQTAGRGRRGKQWFSPFGCNLYFSMYWQLEQGIQAAMGLSLVVGLAVAKVLQQQWQLPVRLKWPNDLYIEHKKLGGILVELAGQTHAQCDVVIGLGLNIRMPEQTDREVDQPWADLTSALGKPIDRNLLVVLLQHQLVQELRQFSQHGFSGYVQDFNQLDQFSGEQVTLSSGNQSTTGFCAGVDAQGGLVLEINGQKQSFYGGELSLRKAL